MSGTRTTHKAEVLYHFCIWLSNKYSNLFQSDEPEK